MHKTQLRESKKSSSAFRTIREVAEHLGVQQHVLRFWESKFTQIQPVKRSGGRRYYRPEDMTVLDVVHNLLHVQGYTIKGAQNLLKGKSKAKIGAMNLRAIDKSSQISDTQSSGTQASEMQGEDVALNANAGNDNGTAHAIGFSDQQRAVLKSMLGELKALRAMVGE
jgi:DNA-binding transcriptional MerR regulator